MGRKKKLINNTDIPQYAIEKFARCVFDDIREAYLNELIQQQFIEWQKEMRSMSIKRGLQEKKARATNENGSSRSFYICFFFPLGPRGLDSGRIFQPFAK